MSTSRFFEKMASIDKKSFVSDFPVIGTAVNALGVDPAVADLGALGMTNPRASLSAIAQQPMSTGSYLLNRRLFSGPSGLAARVRADEIAGAKIVGGLADAGTKALLGGIEATQNKYKKYKDLGKSKKILKDLMSSDEVISSGDPERLSSLYKTMYDVAPTMTKHKEAVRSFLRQGLMHEGGLDPMSIGQLARSEAALTGKQTSRLD